jgi:multiple antibiotic resistance protein
MASALTLFLSAFSTLLALVNPLETLSVFLSLTNDQDEKQRRSIALRSCLYALLLMFFFLIFGTLILRIFGVTLSMVRMAGGLVLIRIGLSLFSGPASSLVTGPSSTTSGPADVAFVPLAMPIMFGPGGIATIIGLTSTAKHSKSELSSFAAISVAIVLAVAVTYICLFRAKQIFKLVGVNGVDAVTRIIGFFISTMGVSLLFSGAVEAVQAYGVRL